MPVKPHSQLLAALIVVQSNLALIRTLGRDGLRLALARVSKGARLFVHPLTWFKVVKVLTAPQTQPVVRAAPEVVLKYLGGYLGANLSESERASILINHYAFLKGRVEQGFFRKIVDGRLQLWKHVVSNRHVRICVAFPVTHHDEGDLSLIFQSDHIDIYTLSFNWSGTRCGSGCRPSDLHSPRARQGERAAADQEGDEGLPGHFACRVAARCR